MPIIPWFFLHWATAIFVSSGFSCAAAAIIGGALGIQSSGRWIASSRRQLTLVVLAATVTYEIGRLFQQLSHGNV